jgi:hypothetical protein
VNGCEAREPQNIVAEGSPLSLSFITFLLPSKVKTDPTPGARFVAMTTIYKNEPVFCLRGGWGGIYYFVTGPAAPV